MRLVTLLLLLCLSVAPALAAPQSPLQFVSARMASGDVIAIDVTSATVHVQAAWWHALKTAERIDATIALSGFAKQQGQTAPLNLFGENGVYIGRIEGSRYIPGSTAPKSFQSAFRPVTHRPAQSSGIPIRSRIAPPGVRAVPGQGAATGQIVYVSVSGNGERFHRWKQCPGLARSQVEARTIQAAMFEGYDRCQECRW